MFRLTRPFRSASTTQAITARRAPASRRSSDAHALQQISGRRKTAYVSPIRVSGQQDRWDVFELRSKRVRHRSPIFHDRFRTGNSNGVVTDWLQWFAYSRTKAPVAHNGPDATAAAWGCGVAAGATRRGLARAPRKHVHRRSAARADCAGAWSTSRRRSCSTTNDARARRRLAPFISWSSPRRGAGRKRRSVVTHHIGSDHPGDGRVVLA